MIYAHPDLIAKKRALLKRQRITDRIIASICAAALAASGFALWGLLP